MSSAAIAALALSVVLAATVQTAIGFGFALVLVPILLALGHGLPEAVAITLGASLWQTSLGLYAVKREVRFREALPLAAIQWLTLPLGVAIMNALVDAGPGRAKQGVGVVLIALLTLRLLTKPATSTPLPRSVVVGAAAASGILSGSVGMGGPPLVLVALARQLSPDRYRAFLWEQFLLITPVQLAVLGMLYGREAFIGFGSGFLLAPALFVGLRLGRAVSGTWDATRLSRAAVAMLYLLAFVSVLAPFFEPGH